MDGDTQVGECTSPRRCTKSPLLAAPMVMTTMTDMRTPSPLRVARMSGSASRPSSSGEPADEVVAATTDGGGGKKKRSKATPASTAEDDSVDEGVVASSAGDTQLLSSSTSQSSLTDDSCCRHVDELIFNEADSDLDLQMLDGADNTTTNAQQQQQRNYGSDTSAGYLTDSSSHGVPVGGNKNLIPSLTNIVPANNCGAGGGGGGGNGGGGSSSLAVMPPSNKMSAAAAASLIGSFLRTRPLSRSAHSIPSQCSAQGSTSSLIAAKAHFRSVSASSVMDTASSSPSVFLAETGGADQRSTPFDLIIADGENEDEETDRLLADLEDDGAEEEDGIVDDLALDDVDDDGCCDDDDDDDDEESLQTPGPFRMGNRRHAMEEEEDPNAELPLMSTILERMPWNPMRAREYLYHYLELAQHSGDDYKVQKLKQQLKYLTIRNKKRSYRNIAHHAENACGTPEQDQQFPERWSGDRPIAALRPAAGQSWSLALEPSPPALVAPSPMAPVDAWTARQPAVAQQDSWWRNGMRTNMHPMPAPPQPPPPPPLLPQQPPQWEHRPPAIPPPRRPPPVWEAMLPRPNFRMPLFRPENNQCCRPRPIPVPPMGWPSPYWSNYGGGWPRPQPPPPAWGSPCRPGFPPAWNGYRGGLRPVFPIAAGGDIMGNRQFSLVPHPQDRRWVPQPLKKNGKF